MQVKLVIGLIPMCNTLFSNSKCVSINLGDYKIEIYEKIIVGSNIKRPVTVTPRNHPYVSIIVNSKY